MDQPKQDALKAIVGEDLLTQLLTQADQTTKAADAAGVVFKEAEVAPEVTADDALDDGDIAVGDMSPDEFGGLLRIANQPLVDALGAFAAAITGTAAQTATKEAAINTRLAEVETKAAAVPDLATQLATTKAALATAQAEIAELKGDVPRSLSERRASQSPATVITKEHPLASDDAQPRGDPNFITSFVLGQPVQQGA